MNGMLFCVSSQGVFVPTTQNILGIILFIRLPFITAQAGIFEVRGTKQLLLGRPRLEDCARPVSSTHF